MALPPALMDGTLHDQMMDLITDSGLGDLAKESGLVSSTGLLATAPPQSVLPPQLPGEAGGASGASSSSSSAGGLSGSGAQPAASSSGSSSTTTTTTTTTTTATTAATGASPSTATTTTSTTTPGNLKRRRDDEQIATMALVASSRRASVTPKRKKASKARAPGATPNSEAKSKGLRHFSLRVCQKVRQKNKTTHNEVANELVEEFMEEARIAGTVDKLNPKNIRRRVYDALNVLTAIDIIKREKKDIHWLGLPSDDVMKIESLRARIDSKKESIVAKERHLHELLTQLLTLHNLVTRNKGRKRKAARNLLGEPTEPSAATTSLVDELDAGFDPAEDTEASRVYLPFVIVTTPRDTIIDCEMAVDRSEFAFAFTQPFELLDDAEVLKRMGMRFASQDVLNDIIPPDLRQFVPEDIIVQE